MKESFLLILIMFWTMFLRFFLRSKRDQEILMLRKELQILKRQSNKPKFSHLDRLFFISLFKANPKVIANLITIKPSTIMAWHRKLVKKKWDYSNRKPGRPPISNEIKQLILQMKLANTRWGCRKINGELRKLGIAVGKSAIAKILIDGGHSAADRKFERTWMNFISSHATRYFSCDFMVVDTLFLKKLYLFSVIDVSNRQIVLFNVTENPTASWLETVVRCGFNSLGNLPKVMVSDRDGIYGEWFGKFLEDYFEIELIRAPPRCPNCNAFIERWHRSLREEALDHCIVFGKRDLQKIVGEYVKYYNYHRPHQGIGQNSPLKNHGLKKTSSSELKFVRKKMVDGIITNFELAA